MNDPRETLNRIRKQAAAATEGPWEADGMEGTITSKTDGLVTDPKGPYLVVDGITMWAEPDAEFIAAARTDVPALLDALEKVLELHQPVTDGMGFTEDGYGGISPACGACGTSDEYAVPYPCPTVEAITAALEAIK